MASREERKGRDAAGSNAAEILHTFPVDKCPKRGAKFIPKLADAYITTRLQYDSTLDES